VNKSKLYGLIGSTLSSTILLFILWFVVLSVPGSTENQGFLVSFGDSYDGGGVGNAIPAATVKQSTNEEVVPKIKETVTVSKTTNQHVFTQTENSVSITEKNEKNRLKKDQQAQFIEQNERNKRIIEQKQKEQEAKNKADNLIGGSFANNNSTGSGASGGNGTGKGYGSGSGLGKQGNPAGKGNTGVGFTLNLGNRNYLGNPVKPKYPKDVEGKITVNIEVDQNGAVTSTSIGSPTTISDSEMRRDAASAASKTQFTPGKNTERGTITYNYRLQ
jgi:TonB family protein